MGQLCGVWGRQFVAFSSTKSKRAASEGRSFVAGLAAVIYRWLNVRRVISADGPAKGLSNAPTQVASDALSFHCRWLAAAITADLPTSHAYFQSRLYSCITCSWQSFPGVYTSAARLDCFHLLLICQPNRLCKYSCHLSHPRFGFTSHCHSIRRR